MKQISFKLEIFEGPLDLLLHLIHKNKVSIYDIPISEITEQYMDYLSEMQHFDIEVSSEFLVLAANLLYIKSKILLPKYDDVEEEDDPRLELAERLILYQRFKEAAQFLREKEAIAQTSFYKVGDYIEPLLIDESLSQITTGHLFSAIEEVAERIFYRRPISAKTFTGIVGRELISVFSKVKAVLSKLRDRKKIPMSDVFRNMRSKDEVVASFLAVLELVKMNRVKVKENNGIYEINYINKPKGGDMIGDTEA